MKIPYGKNGQRKAISPIIATVLIIAVTLIASVAIGGFVFGIFGSSSQSAQISVTNTSLAAANFLAANAGTTFTCSATFAPGTTLTLTNAGTSGAAVTGATITWAGANNAFAPSAACPVGAAGSATATVYLVFTTPQMTADAVAGQTYSGTVTLSNGATLLVTGTWQ